MSHRPRSSFEGFWYYLRCKTLGRPVLVNLEFTKHCNAKCSFCACWQTSSKGELNDYSPIIRKFRPVVLSVSGGEPLLRKNYPDLLRGVRPYCHYLALITNGALLTPDSAEKLARAGVDQISVSLDFLGKRHDELRKIDGLYAHLAKTIPALARKGYKIILNTVIMESNLSEILPIAYRAAEWGVSVSFSAYCSLKSDCTSGMIGSDRYTQLVKIVEEIRQLKRKLGNIKNSDYYLNALPKYFRDGHIPGCKAGYHWLQVTPDGFIQQCSELPRVCHYSEFSRDKIKPVTCSKCWYTCRGEAEAPPLKPKRLLELLRA